jgi:CBS domain-containing protein
MIEMLTIRDVIVPREDSLVAVKSDEKLSLLFSTLREKKVLGAVVVETDGKVRGFVDVLDILSYLVLSASQGREEVSATDVKAVVSNYGPVSDAFRVGNLVNLSGSNMLRVVDESTKIVDAMRIMQNEVHRLAVNDSSGNLVGIFSQSDVIRLFAQRGVSLGRLIDTRIDLLTLGTGDVFSVKESAFLFDALQKMRANRLSAAAVVDHRGFLVANLSVSDLKGINPSTLETLTLSVKEFLFSTYGFPKAPIVVRTWETVEHVLIKLVFHGVHRVWVVNEKMTPLGVITMTDLIRFFLSN